MSSALTAELAQCPEIADDVGGAAGEQPPFAVRRSGRHRLAIALDAIGQRDLARIAPGLGGEPAQPRDAGA